MKIAQVAPLFESVPPKFYGGTERVVSYLTEELVRQGHDITLYASGDSETKAHLIPLCHRSLRLDNQIEFPDAYLILQIEKMIQDGGEYELVHSHIDVSFFPSARRLRAPVLTTLHGRLDFKELGEIYKQFHEMPVVSISNAQREPIPQANWVETIYHGLPTDLYPFQEKKGSYFAFLGRISPEKRLDWAIEIAKKAGIPLKIAAKVDRVDREYFDMVIKPLLDHPLIEYVGEIGECEKKNFLGNAYALLFPIDWPEPFGLVMIEAMACGTPVIARHRGSVPEVIVPGVNGYIVQDVAEAVAAVKKLDAISRRDCRNYFEGHFTAEIMARRYVEVYKKLQKLQGRLPAGVRG